MFSLACSGGAFLFLTYVDLQAVRKCAVRSLPTDHRCWEDESIS